MPQGNNVSLFRMLIEEGFNKGNLSALDGLVTPDFKERQNGINPPTLEGLKHSINGLRTAFPDLNLIIEDIVIDDDRIWARIKARGTHRGSMMGLPPSGKAITVDVIDVCRFADGKIAEHWGVADRLGMMQQIGAIPPPQSPQKR
jgi:steroid delta-isomerase-like uncharacterized protein